MAAGVQPVHWIRAVAGPAALRLSTYLPIQIFVSGLCVLALTLAGVMYVDQRNMRAEVVRAGSAMARILDLQLTGPLQGIVIAPRFPDWYPVTRVRRPDGSCIRLLTADGRQLRSECRGPEYRQSRVPSWFGELYRRVFLPGAPRTFDLRRGHVLRIEPDADSETYLAWRSVAHTAPPLALLIAAMGGIVWWLLRRALRPLRGIVEAIGAVERGGFDAVVGPFRWREFARIASAFNAMAASLREGRAERAALSGRLLQVQRDERVRLARELHDEFGQHLSAIAASAAALRARPGAQPQEDVQRIEDSVRVMMAQLREVLARLRIDDADGVDLASALGGLVADGVPGDAAPQASLQVSGRHETLPATVAAALYRVAQESLTNVQRHAGADRVTVALAVDNDCARLVVEDNGRGCDPGALQGGYGVAGMRERIAVLGGTLDITSARDDGFRVSASVPLGTMADVA